jgi:hypothetical protein
MLDGDDERIPLMSDFDRKEPDPADKNGVRAHSHAQSSQSQSDTEIDSQTETQDQVRRPNNSTNHPDNPLETVEVVSTPTPRLLRHEGVWKHLRWVPFPVRRFCHASAAWARGPPNPRRLTIKPLFPTIQTYPIRLKEKLMPKSEHRAGLAFFYFAIWIVTYALVKRQESFVGEIAEWGVPQDIGCGVTFWGAGNSCGLNGGDCRPFNGSGFAFRCAANCASYQVLNPRAVGPQEINYRSFVIGGPNDTSSGDAVYRGDSFVCGAAIHAGLASNAEGGCGVLNLVGRRQNYASSDRNGIESIGFDSYFPLSYSFLKGVQCQSRDFRWILLGVSVVFTIFLSLFTTSPAVFFFGTFIGIFWHVGIAGDPPPSRTIAALVSNLVGKFLPGMFVAWVIYDKMGVRRTLSGLTAQIEKTVLWVGACWFGSLENYSFRWIPISRLTPHDLQQQPGARAALAMIILVLLVVAVVQVWHFRAEGRLIKYLKLYGLFVIGILICLAIPTLKLRIHHYILGLLLLPGTSMQTRLSLLCQGLLVGLFINGIARWGFDPILQTAAALQGDAQLGSDLPVILAPVINLAQNISTITFKWQAPPEDYDGISVLINDVERFRTYFQDEDLGQIDSFSWPRSSNLGLNEYFRFAYMTASQTWDYTKAGTWTAQGQWLEMLPGPSKIKSRSVDFEFMQR